MFRWQAALLGALIAVSASFAQAQTCPGAFNLTGGQDLVATIAAAPAGSTICLGPGSYSPSAAGYPADGNTFAVHKQLHIVGTGASPSQVILQGSSASGYLLWFVNASSNVSGSSLRNLTLQGATGGIQLFNFVAPATRLTDITIKDVVINTTNTTGTAARGIYTQSADRIVVDNVTVTSILDNFFLVDTFDSVVMNSTAQYNGNVLAPNGGIGFSVIRGGRNTIVNNTIGGSLPPGRQFSFNGGGVVFYSSPDNRFENNLVRFFHDDGVDFHARPEDVPLQKSSDNYAGKNVIISQARALAGTTHGAAMWANCGSDRTWMFGNENSGVPECGICVYTAVSNMALANKLYDNGIGYHISGGSETTPFCAVPAFQSRPINMFVHGNNASWNISDQLYIRSADNTEITSNFMSPRNGFGGALRPEACLTPYCQSAITFDTQGATAATNGARVAANINHENTRGVYIDDGKTVGITFAYNKMIQPNSLSHSRYNLPPTLVGPGTIWDAGAVTGGNFWSQFSGANGNPGNAPYGTPSFGDATKGVFDGTNNTGKIVDRYAYLTEDLGRGFAVTVSEPRTPAGASFAAGTKRTVRWHSPGCVYNDVLLDGTTPLASNVGNTGYAVVTLPAVSGSHNIVVTCKNSAGTALGSAASGNFAITTGDLQLLAPGRDDVFNAGTSIWVAWKKSAAVTSAVTVEVSTNGGSTWASLGSFTGTAARVTLPGGAAVYNAMIRVRSTTPVTSDYTDGYFAIRGTGQAFVNMAGRKLIMGQLERLEWSSPPSSRSVNITATVGGVQKPVATGLPDRGSFDWIVPEWAAVGAVTLNATFLNSAGGNLGTATSAAATVAFPTTITYTSAPNFLGTGTGAPVVATANSGLATTLTSLTPSVCTIAGTTVTGVAGGTCTIAANQAGNGSYAAAPQVTKSFLVGSSPPRLANISTRGQVLTGANVMIGGFIISGSTNKTVAVVATGPSLVPFGIPNALGNPTLSLVRQSDGATIATNDDWQGGCPQAGACATGAQLSAAGFAPSHPLESAMLVTLPPGAYTAILSGVAGGTGVGVVAVYEVDQFATPLINISTRGRVGTGVDVMIGGFVIQGSGPQTVAVVATGPSLAPFGIPTPLQNPTLQLVRQSDGVVIATNDNWGSASNAAQIQAAGFAPSHSLESAIMMSLPPGAYTAILQGVSGGTGTGIVAVYKVP